LLQKALKESKILDIRRNIFKKVVFLLLGISLIILTISYFCNLGTYLSLHNFVDWEGVDIEGGGVICNQFGCYWDENRRIYTIDGRILEVNSENLLDGKSPIEVKLEILNRNSNEINHLTVELERDLLQEVSDFQGDSYPRNFRIEFSLQKKGWPEIKVSNPLELKVFFYEIGRVSFLDLQGKYLPPDSNIEENMWVSDLSQALNSSLRQEEEEYENSSRKSVVKKIFLFEGTVSEEKLSYTELILEDITGDYILDNWDRIFLWDSAGIAQTKSAIELQDNCRVLKKYFPSESCSNPHIKLEGWIKSLMLTLEISNLEGEEKLLGNGDVAVVTPESVLKFRNDPERWGSFNEARLSDSLIAKRLKIMAEYLYYSGLTCRDISPEMCEDMEFLYKYLVYKEEGGLGFCSRRTFLPVLSMVFESANVRDSLKSVLGGYPFEGECTRSDSFGGFCSVSLEERISCMELLSESLFYYGKDSRTEKTLEEILLNTLSLYWEENVSAVGLWGSGDINALSRADSPDKMFVVKYYDFIDNAKLYSVLERSLE
jgi:hypothetical protein